jgi:hypothetical protein
MLIHKKSDRIEVEFTCENDEKITAYFSPLTGGEKSLIIAQAPSQTDTAAVLGFAKAVIRSTLKEIRGITCLDGSSYVLQIQDGKVTEECLDEVMNIPELFSKTMTVSSLFLAGIPKDGQVINPANGEPVPGVIVKKSIVQAKN